MTIQKINKADSKGMSKQGIFALVLAMALCFSGALFGCSSQDSSSQQPQDGQASYKSEQEKQDELNRKVEEGMLDISIASVIDFEDGNSFGVANIENVPGNIYDIKVTIEEEDTGDVLYKSDTIKPNQYIEKIKLGKDLPAGTYPAIATFTAYNQETGDEEGEAAAKITLEVAN